MLSTGYSSSVLEQVVAIHSGMATEWAGLVSSQASGASVFSDIRHLAAIQYKADVVLAGGRTPQLSCERT
ncbi:hypothetical protein TNCV_1524251 [Trichonephila clavipes]|nr:hypothetical protein TNCV_1524251 [Trichonephila clavipes]